MNCSYVFRQNKLEKLNIRQKTKIQMKTKVDQEMVMWIKLWLESLWSDCLSMSCLEQNCTCHLTKVNISFSAQ